MTNEKHEIKRILYFCPLCEEKHEIVEISYYDKAIVKSKEVEYLKRSYYCEIENEEFTPDTLMDYNLNEAREIYRKSENLLTSAQIKEIRDLYGLTQKEYANLLGLGDVTIQRYESRSIQDPTYDDLMRLTKENPAYCLELLNKNKEKFENARYEDMKRAIINVIKKNGNLYFVRETLKNAYIEYDKPTEANGYCLLDINKLSGIIHYIAKYVDSLYKVKLMKMLWYVDALSFKTYNKAMSGLVYQHFPLGAVPIAHNEIIKLPSVNVLEEEHPEYTAYKILPNPDFHLYDFTFEELDILQSVIKKFKSFSTQQIVSYMHGEDAYKFTEDNEIISFNHALNMKNFN